MIDNAKELKKRAWEKYGEYETLEAERKILFRKIGKLHDIIYINPFSGIVTVCKKELKKYIYR